MKDKDTITRFWKSVCYVWVKETDEKDTRAKDEKEERDRKYAEELARIEKRLNELKAKEMSRLSKDERTAKFTIRNDLNMSLNKYKSIKIPILKKTGYSTWKVKMLMHLEATDLDYLDLKEKSEWTPKEKAAVLKDAKVSHSAKQPIFGGKDSNVMQIATLLVNGLKRMQFRKSQKKRSFRKKFTGGERKSSGRREGKDFKAGKVDRSKTKWYNCDEPGHFAIECKKTKNDKGKNKALITSSTDWMVSTNSENEETCYALMASFDTPASFDSKVSTSFFSFDTEDISELKSILKSLHEADEPKSTLKKGSTSESQKKVVDDKTQKEENKETIKTVKKEKNIGLLSKRQLKKKLSEGNKKNTLVLDNGCSGYMDGNKSLLSEFETKVLIEDLALVKGLKHNLLSISQITDRGYHVVFHDSHCEVVHNKTNKVVLMGYKHGNMYEARLHESLEQVATCLISKALVDESWNWHKKLSHLNFNSINELAKKKLVRGLPNMLYSSDGLCDAFQKSKQRRVSFKSKTEFSITEPYHMLHLDLFGPVYIMSINKKRHTIVIVDDFTRYTWVYFLHRKDESPEILLDYVRQIENGSNFKVIILRSDNGTEFKNSKVEEVYTHSDPEDDHCTNEPAHVEGEQQQGSTDSTNTEESTLGSFQSDHSKSNVDSTSGEHVSIPNSSSGVNITDSGGASNAFDEAHDSGGASSSRRTFPSARKWTKDHTPDLIIGNLDEAIRTRCATQNECMYHNLLSKEEPKKIEDALKDADWVIAIQEELNEFERNKVWKLVPRPKNRLSVGTKWVFRNKTDFDGTIVRNKARLDKALYGLKQAPRAWYETLAQFLLESGFKRESATAITLIVTATKLDPHEGITVDFTNYKGMIGSLLYLTASRPDIMFATCLCARFQENPREPHLIVVKRIFRYLKGTTSLGLRKKQKSIFTSTAEAEYIAAGSCRAQLLWMRNRLMDYELSFCKIHIYCDNQSVIVMTVNPVQHSLTKHISIRYHFIREHVMEGTIELHFVPTDQQLTDMFTKPLPKATLTKLVNELASLPFKVSRFFPALLNAGKNSERAAKIASASKRDALDAGLRFPLHPFFPHLLADLQINPCQLPPNAWRNILCFMVCCLREGFPLSVAVLGRFFNVTIALLVIVVGSMSNKDPNVSIFLTAPPFLTITKIGGIVSSGYVGRMATGAHDSVPPSGSRQGDQRGEHSLVEETARMKKARLAGLDTRGKTTEPIFLRKHKEPMGEASAEGAEGHSAPITAAAPATAATGAFQPLWGYRGGIHQACLGLKKYAALEKKFKRKEEKLGESNAALVVLRAEKDMAIDNYLDSEEFAQSMRIRDDSVFPGFFRTGWDTALGTVNEACPDINPSDYICPDDEALLQRFRTRVVVSDHIPQDPLLPPPESSSRPAEEDISSSSFETTETSSESGGDDDMDAEGTSAP
ncbi:hypothetical protein AgCh_012279 [Apium graveolens]